MMRERVLTLGVAKTGHFYSLNLFFSDSDISMQRIFPECLPNDVNSTDFAFRSSGLRFQP